MARKPHYVPPPKPEGRRTAQFKPAKFKDHLTLQELADKVKRHPSRLRKLEKAGTIPQAPRVRVGEIEIRLYSPSMVTEIAAIIKTLRPGRPRGG